MGQFSALIIEDEVTYSQSIVRSLESLGVICEVAETGAQAREFFNSNKIYDVVIVDCLLPDENGADLIAEESIKKRLNRSMVVFISGIFTDLASKSEITEKTGSSHFFTKPFELDDLKSLITPLLKSKSTTDFTTKNPLSILMDVSASVRKKQKAIESLDVIDGFDLPMIYSVLVETRASGHLNIIGENSEIAGVSFSEGNIVRVDLRDKTSYLGQMLVDSGYLSAHELEEQLSVRDNLKLGERLIQKCYISPHAFNELLEYQMHIRLSKTVEVNSVRINFVRDKVALQEPLISHEEFLTFLHDWIVSKMNKSWLEARLRPFYTCKVSAGPFYSASHAIFESKLLVSLPSLWEGLTSSSSLGEYIETCETPKGMVLKAIHYLFLKRMIIFDTESKGSLEQFDKQVSKVLKEVMNQDYFVVFEVISGKPMIEAEEAHSVFENFIDFISFGKGADLPDDLQQKVDQVLLIVKNAYSVLSNKDKRKEYIENLQKTEYSTKLLTQQNFEEGIRFLKNGDYLKAYQKFEIIQKNGMRFELFGLYSCWAKLECYENKLLPSLNLSEIEFELMEVPPEEKHGALYAFVNGKEQALKGHFREAKRLYEKARSLDPRMIQARRELNRLQLKEKNSHKNKDFLNRDLKEMVTSLFRKKSS